MFLAIMKRGDYLLAWDTQGRRPSQTCFLYSTGRRRKKYKQSVTLILPAKMNYFQTINGYDDIIILRMTSKPSTHSDDDHRVPLIRHYTTTKTKSAPGDEAPGTSVLKELANPYHSGINQGLNLKRSAVVLQKGDNLC